MAMIQVVVTLTETDYNIICKFGYVPDSWSKDIGNAIREGIVLPKGHGDLIDRDRLIGRCLFMSNDDTAIEGMEYVTKGMIETAPTIIKADKDGE